MIPYMVGNLAPNSSHFTRGLVKYVPGRGCFRAVPSQNRNKYVTSPPPPIVELVVPSLSESQMKEAVPRRLTNPRAEVAALSTGVEDVVPVVVFDANINDEYAAEATSV